MSRLLPIGLLSLALAAFAATPRSAGHARSDYPFVVAGVEVSGGGTILEGETVSASYLPVRLFLSNGAFVVLGAGSRARVNGTRILLDGVSLEVLRAGTPPLEVEAHRFSFTAADETTRFLLYSDSPDAVSAAVLAGEVTPYAFGAGSQDVMQPGQEATFSEDFGEFRAQPFRAPLEMARIQLRQIDLMAELGTSLPPLRKKLRALGDRIAEASGGLLRSEAVLATSELIAPTTPTGVAAIEPGRLMFAVDIVRSQLHRSGLQLTGCGDPDCQSSQPPAMPASFRGWAGGLRPVDGCILCRSAAERAPGDPIIP